MRLDHLFYAARPDELDDTARWLGRELGVEPLDGGVHPRFGTRNRLLPLAGGHYVEVVAVLDHPSTDAIPFGQSVRARADAGGGWLAWVVAVDDLATAERRLGRPPIQANRRRPDGYELLWKQIGVNGLRVDPQLPFLVRWESDPGEHPSRWGHGAGVVGIDIGGDPDRVTEWLGAPEDRILDDVEVVWVGANGRPGLRSVRFRTGRGTVQI